MLLQKAATRLRENGYLQERKFDRVGCNFYAIALDNKALTYTEMCRSDVLTINNRNTRTRCEICSKLTIKTPERLTCDC